MKNIFAILLCVAFLLLASTGCNSLSDDDIRNNESKSTEAKEVYFKARVVEVSGKTLVISPIEDYSEARSSDKISVQSWFEEGRVKTGDLVGIYYDGAILETYPAQLSKVFAMELYSTDGQVAENIRK
ncbi:MAG: hypothetical protein J6L85_05410 [Clostridia bacterium]|nr:hypothetical protein [Clostridia bacterium]